MNGQLFLFYGPKSPLSNFHPCGFFIGETEFRCAEQAIMYRKARLFGDEQAAREILQATDPAIQKRLGRRVKGFTEAVWRQHRVLTAYRVLYAKFSQNEDLRKALLETAPLRLAEASPTDRIWGIGLAATDPRSTDPAQWRGTNLLGETLTLLRADLR